jgi:ankyrin repeat protein
VELLLAHGAKVDARTSFGATPLDLAAQQGYLNVAGMLIASGADVNSRSQSGTSILYDAIKGGHYGVVELLVENGADVNVRTAAGRTPLEVAREAGREDIVQVLTHRAAGASDAGNSERDVNMPTQPRTDRMTTAYRLENTLKTMGIVDAFNDPRVTPKTGDRADFSAMDGARDLFIIAVIHKALVEVSEEGTEAAAVTAVAMAGGGPPPPPVFRADHPFLFLIQKNDTGDILFMGRVATPGEETK